jgi:hypothetical protein
MYRIRAFNRTTGESMQRPEFPRLLDYPHNSDWYQAYYVYLSAVKRFDAFAAECPAFPAYQRPKMVHATERGIPVPRTGYRRWNSGANKGKTGVIANSHVVSHRYMDEGDKGSSLRREIKRKERILVSQEIAEGIEEYRMETEIPDDEYEDYYEFGCGDSLCSVCGWNTESDDEEIA